ncbi:glycoside hydrolase family 97 protein [Marinoscillum sp. MHG1-6]|uniref:glycoside hydrolase family 97 protein n=1 Tax=Marinoscillum sp. MHG1-6 TaxID=2959627 RepID=UPI002157917C|nr:glycoside hydrolase family 97 protein [Marinoscillum sp. MHG1-6]
MKNLILAVAISIIALSCNQKLKSEDFIGASPNGTVTFNFSLDQNGRPYYTSSFTGSAVIDTSYLGFELGDGISLNDGLSVLSSSKSSFDETWEQPWGEQRLIRNNYNETRVELANEQGVKVAVIFRAFDNALAFRYEFPEQEGLKDFKVVDELTEFNMANDQDAWWIPAFGGNRYEYEYAKNKISELNKIHTPVTMEGNTYVAIHEADLTNYSSMVLTGNGTTKLKCDLVPYSTTDPTKAYLSAPFSTPWRMILMGKSAGDLMTNYTVLNLNEPNKLGDVSWVEPGKYVGVWWEMFVNIGTWHQGPKHAANTDNVKKYIDFASANGFKGVLVEGWNYGWDGNWMGGGTKFNFTKPYPDYDIDELSKYAADKGVYIIGHHETGADIDNYDAQLDDAYKYLSDYGLKTVKTGYVENGDTLPNGLYHHGQAFVQHFQRVIETGAKHKTMIVAHEPIKDTGKRRTYPNMVSREGARGQEYNAMGGNRADHVTILPFTRCLAAPFDYTPGVFDIKVKTRPGEQVWSTLTRELALYLVIYAPMEMANDLPENYEGHPALQFIRDVPTDWETTKVLSGQIGDHLAVARQERGTENWFVGAITDEEARTTTINFDFLPEGTTYKAVIYRNSDDADYIDNPTGYTIEEVTVNSTSSIDFNLCRAGGVAISLFKG